MSFILPIAGNFGLDVTGTDAVDRPVSLTSVLAFVTTAQTDTDTDAQQAIADYLDDLIAEVFAEFEAETRKPITRNAAHPYKFEGNAKPYHVIQLPRVNSVSKLEYFDRSTKTWLEIPAAQYYVNESDGHYELGDYLFAADIPYKATIDAGYTFGTSGTLPADIQDAVRSMVVLRYYDSRRSGRDRFGLAQEASGGTVTVTLNYDRKTTLEKWAAAVRKYAR